MASSFADFAPVDTPAPKAAAKPTGESASAFDGFVDSTISEAKKFGKSVMKHPARMAAGAIPGAVEALGGAIGGMGVSAAQGLTGLAKGAVSAAKGKDFMPGFNEGMKDVEDAVPKGLLDPETLAGKRMMGLLGVIPAAIHAVGKGTFNMTGSPVAGAAAEGLATLLTFSPTVAAKGLKWAFPKDDVKPIGPGEPGYDVHNTGEGKAPKGKKDKDATAIQKAFGSLVKTDPQKARDLATHIGKEDEALAKELHKRMDEIIVGKEQLGKIFEKKSSTDTALEGMEPPQDLFALAKQNSAEVGTITPKELRDPMQARTEAQLRQDEITRQGAKTPEQASSDIRSTMSAAHETMDSPSFETEQKAQERLVQKGPGKLQGGWIKLKGGMWHPEAVERLSTAITDNLARGVGDAEAARAPAGTQLDVMAKAQEPIVNWGKRTVSNYLNKHAGTSTDPLKDIQVPFGEGTKRWEELTDGIIHSDIVGKTVHQGWKGFENARSGEEVWQVKGQNAITSYLSHVGDYLRQHVPAEKLAQYDLVRAVKETAKWDKELAKNMEKASLDDTKGSPVYKDYGDGMKWIQLTKPGQFARESDTMGHSVRGYEPSSNKSIGGTSHPDWVEASGESGHSTYGLGGWEAIKRGDAKIYSLRDAKGRSHVTVEVGPNKSFGGEIDPDITQIKGKQNRAPASEYLPYVQDFVKGGQWGEVGDLHNTGLVKNDKGAYVAQETYRNQYEQNERDIAGHRDPRRGPGRGQAGVLDMRGVAEPIRKAFNFAKQSPGVRKVGREIEISVQQALRVIAPEALGDKAKVAAAVLGKAISEQMRDDSQVYHQGKERLDFWQSLKPAEQSKFIKAFEKGEIPSDKNLAAAFRGYNDWNTRILEGDSALGIKYEALDNYLYHVFEDGDKVSEFFYKKYGSKWGDPRYTKDRKFELYEQAVKAGFRPKTTNPEEIMQLRQHASNVAKMQINSLREMEKYGIAKPVTKGSKAAPGESIRRAPNGERYYLSNEAYTVLNNAFDSASLWNMKGVIGQGFRGIMYLKNALVPIKLALSLFHPLHVQTIDNATSMVRASKELLSGELGPVDWAKQMAGAALYKGFIDNPRTGNSILKAWQGRIPAEQLTDVHRQALTYMAEGGMIPEMSAEYKNRAVDGFKKAVKDHSATAILKLPFAAIETLQKPLFDVWIPALKVASYLKDVQSAIKVNPELLNDPKARQVAFRKLSKSIDNRYGEMAYSTLFWQRWIKDIGVGSTLSLGWNLGFLREYGGSAGDAYQAAKSGSVQSAAKVGHLDRPMFVAFYTAQSLLYGGLLTAFMTQDWPQGLIDYIYPQSGEKDTDGQPKRLSTMFYAREFASIYKHMQNDGIISGLGDAVLNKVSPVISDLKEQWTNTDYLGREISDPNSSAYKQLEQRIAHELKNLEPISVSAPERSGSPSLKELYNDPSKITGQVVKDRTLGVLGFTPAPRYVTESRAESMIKKEFTEYVQHKKTPFANAERSEDSSKLRRLYLTGDIEGFVEKARDMKEKYHLDSTQVQRLKQNAKVPGDIKMFKSLDTEAQMRILKKIPEDDRERYMRYAHKRAKHQLRMEAE